MTSIEWRRFLTSRRRPILASTGVVLGVVISLSGDAVVGALFLWLSAGLTLLLHPLPGDSDERSGPQRGPASSLSDLHPVQRALIEQYAGRMASELSALTAGRAEFPNTESWRTVYEKLLRSPDVTEYRSVAWVKTSDYWQDLPAQQSMKLNFELIDRGVRVERILIMGWHLWPPESRLPSSMVRRWIDDQHYRGIAILLVRENELLNEPDLLRDFGIYGDRATGEQELDEQSRTIRFVLNFDQPSIRAAVDRWERLQLFARPYSELLDQA